MVHIFNPITVEAEVGGSFEFQASLSSRAVRQINPASNKQTPQQTNNNKKTKQKFILCVCVSFAYMYVFSPRVCSALGGQIL